MKSWRALRAVARVELRDLRRHLGRSLLVALLVAVPVAALVGGGALSATTQPTLAEHHARAMGQATLRFEWGMDRGLEQARAILPPGARVEPVFAGEVQLRTPGRRLAARAFALDSEGLAAGLLRVTAGRAPSGAEELALSPTLIEGLGLALGDRVSVEAVEERQLVGAVVAPESIDSSVALFPLDAAPLMSSRTLLVDASPELAVKLAARLRAEGSQALARAEIESGDGFESIALFVVGGFGFFEAALVVAAAFAVGVRRRQRELGLLAATGATSADVRGGILLSAGVLALLGCLLGVAVGVGAAWAMVPRLDAWNGRLNGPLELSPMHLVGACLLGVAAAMAAAFLPARGVARMSIRVALGGSRPLRGSSRGWLLVGLTLIGLGLGSLGLGFTSSTEAAGVGVLGGSMLTVLGLGACSPWLLSVLARCAGPLPLAWRLALRDAGRFRARNGPVVTAVLAGLSISVLIAALVHSIERAAADRPATMPIDELLVEGAAAEESAQRIAAELGGRAFSSAERARAGGEAFGLGAPAAWTVRLESPVTPTALERAQATAALAVATTVDADLLYRRPERAWLHVLLLVCVLSGLIVVLIATALSSVESAADARVLHTVGAAPSVLRTLTAARAGYLAFLGCALAIPAGLVPAAGLMRMADVELGFALPWTEVFGALFLLPATAFAVTWLAAATRARSTPALRTSD